MDNYCLNVDSPNRGGYFSGEQIDLLSIVRCTSPEELVEFVNQCIQLNSTYKSIDVHKMIRNIGLEGVKRIIFKAYQDSMVLYDSDMEIVMTNTFN